MAKNTNEKTTKSKKIDLKKATKYGIGFLITGGITAAIAVPVVLSNSEITDHRIFNTFNTTEDKIVSGSIAGGLGSQNIETEKTKVDSKLRTKVDQTTTKFLYAEEVKGSHKWQELNFRWEQLSQLFDVWGYIEATIRNYDGLKGLNVEKQEDLLARLVDEKTKEPKLIEYEKLFEEFKVLINAKITELKKSESNKSIYDSYQKKLDEFVAEWGKLKEKIEVVINKTFDYDEPLFYSKYPLLLSPADEIKIRQQKIYEDAKNSFIEKYKEKSSGESVWLTEELSKRYGGATNEEEAVDYLVNQKIKTEAFKRYDYKINEAYSIRKTKSYIFKEIVGTLPEKPEIPNAEGFYLTTKGASYSKDHLDIKKTDEKIYFLSNSSKIIEKINMSNVSNASIKTEINKILNERHLVKLNNIVLNIKQGATSEVPWIVDKELLKKLFTSWGYDTINNSPLEALQKVFTGTTEDEKENEKQLIGNHTSTLDSTQWKSGDLGYMTGLQAVNMVPAFSVGVATALSDINKNDATNPAPSVQNTRNLSLVKGTDVLKKLTTGTVGINGNPSGLVLGFARAALDKGEFANFIKLVNNKPEVNNNFFDKTRNVEIVAFLEKLTTDEIAKYFGSEITKVFNDIVITKAGTDASFDKTGIGQVYEINRANQIYMIPTPEYGIHIVKISTTANVEKEMNEQFKLIADKQNIAEAITDFSKLFNDNFDSSNQLYDLVKNDKDYQKFLTDNIVDYEATKGKTVLQDVEEMLALTVRNNALKRINENDSSKMTNYLIDEFNKDLVSSDLAADPTKIYEFVQWLGGSDV